MKLKQFLFSAALLASMNAIGQSVPTHEMYVDFGITERTDIVSALDKWQPGDNFSNDPDYQDENFFISRVPLKSRFINQNTQANKNLNEENNKNLCWCSPIGEMTKKWGPMPRYNFDGDNFNMWQYINIHANWSNTWFRVPGTFNDVAHKNGVRTGCLYFIDWAEQVSATSSAGKMLAELCAKDGSGNFKYARKLIQFLKYYGIDGLGLNPEGYWSTQLNEDFSSFLAECHKVAKEMNHPFHVEWYAFVSNTGGLNDNGCKLEIGANDKWFHKNGNPVTDVFFLNYNWSESGLQTSAEAAKSLGRSTYDVYAGFDQQGRGYGKYGNAGWTALMRQPVSIVVWGAHDRSQLYAGSTEGGNSDLSVQNEYQKKQELLFTGGSRNVLRTPDITDDAITSSYSDLAKWHGYSKAVIEESALTELPFVTRFNLGNGLSFSKDGVVTFEHKWYNLGLQDLLPTWRWWIDNGDGTTIPADPINCDFTFDDAWFGGSCLKLHGATSKSNIRLFSTKFNVASASDEFTIVLKTLNGTDPKMKLNVSKVGTENTFTSYTLSADGIVQGKWSTVKIKASELGLKAGDVIGCIGLSVEGTDKDYAVLLGEMSFIPKLYKKTPVTPVITHTNVMKRVYNRADFKVIFDVPFSGTRKDEYQDCPIYNEEVNSWYYEVYVKQGEKETLVTATTSWAAYVVSAPFDVNGDKKVKLGVSAVALDGKSESEIAWTGWLDTPDNSTVEGIEIDKPVIKSGETFAIKYIDPTHAPADKWEILNAQTGVVVKDFPSSVSLETALSEIGIYDLRITSGENIELHQALIQISSEEVGAMPEIKTLTANDSDSPISIEKGDKVTYKYIGRNADGYVSRGLRLNEIAFGVPADQLNFNSQSPFTIAFWFKPAVFNHISDGTHLLNIRAAEDRWPDSDWGWLWTHIQASDNKLSFNLKKKESGAGSETKIIAEDFTFVPNQWYHLAVVVDYQNGRNVSLYVNGKLINSGGGITNVKDWKNSYTIMVGGIAANRAGFDGYLDEFQLYNKGLTAEEVKKSMEHQTVIPESLIGYWDFETEPNENNEILSTGSNKTLKGYMTEIKTVSQGVNQYVPVDITYGTGAPFISGSIFKVETKPSWKLEEAQIQGDITGTGEAGSVVAAYPSEGEFNAILTLENGWGSVSKTYRSVTVTDGGVGFADNELEIAYNAYPNPFVDELNIRFANEGTYAIEVFDAAGKMIDAKETTVADGENIHLSVNGAAGIYFINIKQDTKILKALKVIKK